MEKKQNYRYEIVFRTVYLDESFEEIGMETEAVLFSKESTHWMPLPKPPKEGER